MGWSPQPPVEGSAGHPECPPLRELGRAAKRGGLVCQGLGRGAGHRDPARTEGLAVGTAAWAGGKPGTPRQGPGGTSLLAEGSPSPPPGWPQGPHRGRGHGCQAVPNLRTTELRLPHQEPAEFPQLLEPKPGRQLLSSNSQSKESMKVKVAQLCPTLCDPMDYKVHGILQARILEWVSLSLLQGIFPTQGLQPGLPYCRRILYQLSHQESPRILQWVDYPFSMGSSRPRNPTGVSCIAAGFFTS